MEGIDRAEIFVAHPDDEIIGLGGTLSKFKSTGIEIKVIIFHLGGKSVKGVYDEQIGMEVREKELEQVSKFLNFTHEHWNISEIIDRRTVVRKIVQEIRNFKPNIIFTHSPQDRHHLHVGVSSTVTEAAWHASQLYYLDLGDPWRTMDVYYFEVWDLFTHPSLVVDVTNYIEKKKEAMSLYKSQLAAFPRILDYIEALGKVRGAEIGCEYGEAFLRAPILPRYF